MLRCLGSWDGANDYPYYLVCVQCPGLQLRQRKTGG